MITTSLMIISSFLEMLSVGFLIPVVSIIIDGDIENPYVDLSFLSKLTAGLSYNHLLFLIFQFFYFFF